jgi:methylenetetrahydrofolate reductase (NADPH)
LKITDVLEKKSPTLSFEFFPPKTPQQEEHLFEIIIQLKKFNPDFVSVTYGAMGSTREKTFFWVREIKKRFQIEPVAHLTCVAATREEIAGQLEELEKMGIENILALRGDPPAVTSEFIPPANGFHFAKELISFIKKEKPSFCLGCAGFPEGHPRSPTLELDTDFLKQKIEAGADYVVTQLFFDNRHYFNFRERCQKSGIKVPIIPGLMPITNLKQIKKISHLCAATIPAALLEKLEQHKDDPGSVLKIGGEQTFFQAQELLQAKVPGLHFFVMNQAEPIAGILSQLKNLKPPAG